VFAALADACVEGIASFSIVTDSSEGHFDRMMVRNRPSLAGVFES